MFRKSKLFFIIAETPLHPGSGSEVGLVDLPIQRERYTDFPKIESSGLKGCIREAFENSNREINIDNTKIKANNKDLISMIFGPEEGDLHAGSIAFTDAKILLFPVKSLKGVFAWITCPMALERLKRELDTLGLGISKLEIDSTGLVETVPNNCELEVSSGVVLEEFTFKVKKCDKTTKIAEFLADKIFPENEDIYKFWREKLKKDLIILSNDDFTEFVKTSTEVITRIKIDDSTGTVVTGGLWTEEYLPQDTVLYSIAMFSPLRIDRDRKSIHEIFNDKSLQEEVGIISNFFTQGLPQIIQIGGNQTIGKGIARIQLLDNKEVEQGE